ncbi:MAG: nitrous oxide-stimulated promoter family protein [Planctomycetota bacterium]
MTEHEPEIAREKRTIRAMVEIYCQAHHDSNGAVCDDCRAVLEYAHARLDHCPFGGGKTTCAQCPIHCYKAKMRAKMKEIMRHAGPRMACRHPIMAIRHQLQSFKKPQRKN